MRNENRFIDPMPEVQERGFERFANLNHEAVGPAEEAVEPAENDNESLQFPLQSQINRP